MLERIRRKDTVQVTFILPPDPACPAVSVVGDFNDWTPGTHELLVREDGTRAVTVAVPGDERLRFRYLAHGGHWFDEADADGHDGRNSYLEPAGAGPGSTQPRRDPRRPQSARRTGRGVGK